MARRMSKKSEKLDRAKKIHLMVNDDIASIKESMECFNDYSFLSDILEGDRGWVQYSSLSDEQIEEEFLEREHGLRTMPF